MNGEVFLNEIFIRSKVTMMLYESKLAVNHQGNSIDPKGDWCTWAAQKSSFETIDSMGLFLAKGSSAMVAEQFPTL